MKKSVARWLLDVWYKDPFIGVWLMPLGFLFSDAARFRKFLYRIGILKTHTLPVPVIIVGNITVGGTGKTPLVIWLAAMLKTAGYKPGIISRGYRGQASTWPQSVTAESDTTLVGDEAVLIAKHTGCPMAVGPSRVDAARQLLNTSDCNIIISDDGLQHYALNRTIEIAVVDGERRFGNGYCLPAGPLREPIERLQSVDFVVVNGEPSEDREIPMQLVGNQVINVLTGVPQPLSDFNDCHAVAGIGHPERFFKLLAAAGLRCTTHSFPDHHAFTAADITFKDDKAVLMTEKDAVKCRALAGNQHGFVPVTAVLPAEFAEQLLNLLKRKA